MTEKVDLAYVIAAETADAIKSLKETAKASEEVTKALDKTDKSATEASKALDKTDKSATEASKALDKTDKSATDVSVALDKTDTAATEASTALDKVDDSAKDSAKGLDKTDKSATSAAKGLDKTSKAASTVTTKVTKTAKAVRESQRQTAAFGRSAGQAGIQIQQFVGQVQGGTNALLAMSQQAADLGFVLGAPLIGVVVSLAAALALSLSPAAEEAAKQIDILKIKTEEMGEAQKAWYTILTSEKIVRLKEQLADATVAMKGLEKFMTKSRRAQDENSKATKAMSKQYTQAKSEVERISEIIDDYESKLKELNGTTETHSDEVKEFRDNYANLVQTLGVQTALIGKNEREQAKLNAQVMLGAQASSEQLKSVDALIDGYYDQIDAAKELQRVEKINEEISKSIAKRNQGNMSTKISPIFDFTKTAGFGPELEKQIAEENRKLKQASPEASIGMNTEAQLKNLKEVYELGLIAETEYQAQRVSIITESESQIAALQEERFKQQSEGNALMMEGLDMLSSSATSAFTGMLTGAMNAKEAMAAFANTVLNSAVGALVEMGIQTVKNQIIGKSAAAASVAAAAATGTAISAAYATPAALAAVATSGGAAVAGEAALVATVASSKALAVAGRENGGGVQANSMYQLGEKNRPEVMVTDSGMFGVPGDKGKVLNQSQLARIDGESSGGGNVYNISQNITGTGDKDLIAAMAKASEDAYNRINSDISNGSGQTTRNLRANSNYTPNAGGR